MILYLLEKVCGGQKRILANLFLRGQRSKVGTTWTKSNRPGNTYKKERKYTFSYPFSHFNRKLLIYDMILSNAIVFNAKFFEEKNRNSVF